MNNLSYFNCVYILKIADVYSLKNVHFLALNYLCENIIEIYQQANSQYVQLNFEQLKYLLENSDAMQLCTELDLFLMITKWIEAPANLISSLFLTPSTASSSCHSTTSSSSMSSLTSKMYPPDYLASFARTSASCLSSSSSSVGSLNLINDFDLISSRKIKLNNNNNDNDKNNNDNNNNNNINNNNNVILNKKLNNELTKPTNRLKYAVELMKSVRFMCMSADELCDYVEKVEFMHTIAECNVYLLNAYKWHALPKRQHQMIVNEQSKLRNHEMLIAVGETNVYVLNELKQKWDVVSSAPLEENYRN